MFIKNDEEFICLNCGTKVKKLCYTSRDHCNNCLYSIHVDITPGDRECKCLGMLKPLCIVQGKKQMQIEYVCTKCGMHVKNKIADDDNKEALYNIAKEYAKCGRK